MYVATISFFREYPDLKVKRATMVTLVPPALWDLRVYPVHRYVNGLKRHRFNDPPYRKYFVLHNSACRQGYPGLKGEKGEKGESVSAFVKYINCVHRAAFEN